MPQRKMRHLGRISVRSGIHDTQFNQGVVKAAELYNNPNQPTIQPQEKEGDEKRKGNTDILHPLLKPIIPTQPLPPLPLPLIHPHNALLHELPQHLTPYHIRDRRFPAGSQIHGGRRVPQQSAHDIERGEGRGQLGEDIEVGGGAVRVGFGWQESEKRDEDGVGEDRIVGDETWKIHRRYDRGINQLWQQRPESLKSPMSLVQFEVVRWRTYALLRKSEHTITRGEQ